MKVTFIRVAYSLVGLLSISAMTVAQQQPPPTNSSLCVTSRDPLLIVSVASGSPIPTKTPKSFTLENDADVLVRVTDINPFAFQCSVTTTSQGYQETAISSFLGIVGGVANVGASTPNPSGQAQAPSNGARSVAAHGVPQTVPSNSCVDAYLDQVHNGEVLSIQQQRDAINAALQATLNNEQSTLSVFNKAISDLRAETKCNDTVTAAQAIISSRPFSVAPVGNADLANAIDETAIRAQNLLSHLQDRTNACRNELASIIDEDSAFLTALVHGTTSLPSAVDRWRSQLTRLNDVNSQLTSAKANIGSVLQNRENFSIDTSLHGHQEAIKMTISCTPVAVLRVPNATSGSDSSNADKSQQPQNKPNPPASANQWTRTFNFGSGPRFVLAGGIVVSPLAQITFSTSANPAGSGSGLPANIITNQQKSSTRILPIGMLHGRYWDQLPSKRWEQFIPNYISVGVTAKSSDNKGTTIEYLFGPSWAFAERQLFVTAGAYAGQQQRLGGGLTVGQATGLSAANLPIYQTTIWKAGFAVTWAPGGK